MGTTVIVFWSCAFALFFFLVGILFKTLAAAFNSLIATVGEVGALLVLSLLGLLALGVFYVAAHGIVTDGFWKTFLNFALTVFLLLISLGILGWIGGIFFNLFVALAEIAMSAVSYALEWSAAMCEKAYCFFLMVIIKHVNDC